MEEPKKTEISVVEKFKETSGVEGAKNEKAYREHALLSRSRSCELSFAKQQKEYKEQLKQSRNGEIPFRSRSQTMSCSSYFAENQAPKPYMKDRVLTENAKNLTPEQMHALELDIFKPLDFYGILFERMKARDNGEEEEEKDQSTVIDWQDFKTKYIRNWHYPSE